MVFLVVIIEVSSVGLALSQCVDFVLLLAVAFGVLRLLL